MTSPDRHAICPRCGADARGAAWCPSCGRNLRIASGAEESPPREPPPARPPPPPPPPPPVDEPHTGRNVALALVGVAVVAGLVVLAISLGNNNDHATTITDTSALITDTGTTSSADTGTTPGVDTGTSSASSGSQSTADLGTTVTEQDMARVLVAYETAYGNEDVGALGSLFADTLDREDGSGRSEDLQQALQTYQSQFAQLSNPSYQLSSMQFQPGDGEGFATGQYSITSDAGTVTGSIDFHMTVVDGRLLIDQISITPS